MTDINDVKQQIHFGEVFIQESSKGWEIAYRCMSSIDDDFRYWEFKFTPSEPQPIVKSDDGYYATFEDALIVTCNFLAEQLQDVENALNEDE